MADVLDQGVCELIGLGRTVVINPTFPIDVLLDPKVPDNEAIAKDFRPRGLWIGAYTPKILFGSFPIQYFYMNMQRLGKGLHADNELDMLLQVIKRQLEVVLGSLAVSRSSVIQYFLGRAGEGGQGPLYGGTDSERVKAA